MHVGVFVESHDEGETGPDAPLRQEIDIALECLNDLFRDMEAKTDAFGVDRLRFF